MSIFRNGLGSFGGLVQWLGWSILVLLPIAILLLYFLKLRRQPLQVPSTYLWAKTIEDLHVNSLWQKLRQSLLLFLQLLIAGLLILALWRPGWVSSEMHGDRFIFLIDTSASMGTLVDGKSRLEIAKKKALEFIDGLSSDDTAMLISFSDSPIIEHSFTNNHNELKRKIRSIKQTQRHTHIDEALKAAGGLANPGRSSQDERDMQVADAMPATLVMITDGGINHVPEFSPGNLTLAYVPIGDEVESNNFGIVSFSVASNPESPEKQQAFARVLNSSKQDASFSASLYLNDTLIDAVSDRAVKGNGEAKISFDLVGEDISGVLRLQIDGEDDLESDNVANVVFNANRRSRILLLTIQNSVLANSLTTSESQKNSILNTQLPSYLDGDQYKNESRSGYYDLVIYDNCAPKEMPEANTLFIGSAPPDPNWKVSPKQSPVIYVDSDQSHPILSLVEFKNVLVADSSVVTGPRGSTALIDATIGTIFSIGPRRGFQDAVLGFNLIEPDGKGGFAHNTDWPRYFSFTNFTLNVVNYLGSQTEMNMKQNVAPGSTVVLRSSVPVENIKVTPPDSRTVVVNNNDGAFVFNETEKLGLYEVTEGSSKSVDQKFAVNVLNRRESDVSVVENLEIGFETVTGKRTNLVEAIRILENYFNRWLSDSLHRVVHLQ